MAHWFFNGTPEQLFWRQNNFSLKLEITVGIRFYWPWVSLDLYLPQITPYNWRTTNMCVSFFIIIWWIRIRCVNLYTVYSQITRRCVNLETKVLLNHILMCKPQKSIFLKNYQVCKPITSILANHIHFCNLFYKVTYEPITGV